ncbi:hypothetical protein HanRHA438_Chr16g0759221 [Helianthus annuus]|nr:hypothetical protein HanRHA438_Chr16g0759221 [Helianthus annuus]
MFNIWPGMSDMFCTRLIMLPIVYRVMLPIMFSVPICLICLYAFGYDLIMYRVSYASDYMFSIRLCYVLVMSVSTQYLYRFLSVSPQY